VATEPSDTNPLAAFGANEWLVDELYEKYLQDPKSVDPAWLDFFKTYKPGDATPVTTTPADAPRPDAVSDNKTPEAPSRGTAAAAPASSAPAATTAAKQPSTPAPAAAQAAPQQQPAAKQAPAQSGAKQDAAKDAGKDAKDGAKSDASKGDRSKAAKAGAKGAKQPQVLTQTGAPTLTAEQIVSNSDANIERIKKELNLSPEQEKHWNAFNSAMHYLGHNGADRLKLRVARAQRDPPDDIIEQMRNEAQFLNDRAVDQRNVADAADPLFTSLDDKQKQTFINEMVRLSHERGLD